MLEGTSLPSVLSAGNGWLGRRVQGRRDSLDVLLHLGIVPSTSSAGDELARFTHASESRKHLGEHDLADAAIVLGTKLVAQRRAKVPRSNVVVSTAGVHHSGRQFEVRQLLRR